MIDKTKPRVAVYYDVLASTNYRNDGAPLFLNWNLRKILNGNTDLEDHKANVAHLSPCNPSEGFGTFDLNILVDYGEDALGIPIDWKIPSPNAYWVSDAHLGYDYRLKRAKEFDHVFVAQKWFVDKFVADGIPREKIHYLPHAYEPDLYRPLSSIKKWDWCFVGHPNSPHRIVLIDRFIKEFPNYYLGWRMPGVKGHNELEDVNEKYNFARLIINDNVLNDVNMRTFEALGASKLLITQNIPELTDLGFKNGQHLFMYDTIDQAVVYAKMMLADPERLESIAHSGYCEVKHRHTYMHRAKTILETCLNYKPTEELSPC